jgi:hypothetical protein
MDECAAAAGNKHVAPAPAATIVLNSAIAMIREKTIREKSWVTAYVPVIFTRISSGRRSRIS